MIGLTKSETDALERGIVPHPRPNQAMTDAPKTPNAHLSDAASHFQGLQQALKDDAGYAWSWHCSIAMAFVDEGGDQVLANKAAARFMKAAFDVEPDAEHALMRDVSNAIMEEVSSVTSNRDWSDVSNVPGLASAYNAYRLEVKNLQMSCGNLRERLAENEKRMERADSYMALAVHKLQATAASRSELLDLAKILPESSKAYHLLLTYLTESGKRTEQELTPVVK